MKLESECKLCEEIKGLKNIDGKCFSVCGDGILYSEKEECDDGNLNDNDGCTNCKITPILKEANLEMFFK